MAPLTINITPERAKITNDASEIEVVTKLEPTPMNLNNVPVPTPVVKNNMDKAGNPRESISIPDINNPRFLFGLAFMTLLYRSESDSLGEICDLFESLAEPHSPQNF